MSITIDGSGTITGISVGGIPDGVVDTDVLADNAVVFGKIGTTEQGQLCKAWVNFDGTGTVAIRASYNVSSITDNAAGNYVVNFTTAMSDANYNAVGATNTPAGYNTVGQTIANISASTCSVGIVGIIGTSNVAADATYVSVAIFR